MLIAAASKVQRRVGVTVVLMALLAPCAAVAQANLGHKIPGTIGINAGTQIEPGLYVGNRLAYYEALRLRDRNGDPLEIPGFELDALAAVVGVTGAVKLDSGLYLSAALGVPLARISVSTDEPLASIDRLGLGDLFVKPIQLGWRWQQLDLVTSYAFYAPTRQLNRGGLAGPQWSHQLSLGGTLYFDADRQSSISALASWDLYHEKLDLEVTRGDSVQIQGGIGWTLFELVEVGLAGYALWQVRDDRGADLPDALRGRRDRVYGLGPEVKIPIPAISTQLGVRYTRDFGVKGRPQGQLFVVELAMRVWNPE